MPSTRRLSSVVVIVVSAASSVALSTESDRPQTLTPVSGFTVVNVYPHDPAAYTQGLIYRDGFLYESTGLVGRSSLRKVRLETGEIVQRRSVAPPHFAEGLTEWRGRLLQLTWQSRIGFLYERSTFAVAGTFSYLGEGWGLTHDGRRLIQATGCSSPGNSGRSCSRSESGRPPGLY